MSRIIDSILLIVAELFKSAAVDFELFMTKFDKVFRAIPCPTAFQLSFSFQTFNIALY